MLRKYVQDNREDWDVFLDTCSFAYNTSRQESTLHTPFEIMFGRKPVLPVDIDEDHGDDELIGGDESTSSAATLECLTAKRLELLKTVKSNIVKAQIRQKKQYDRKHSLPKSFECGDKVLKKDFTRKKRKGGKLDPKWLGPFSILKNLGKGFYKLESLECPGTYVERVNGSHLKIYKEHKR